MGETTVGRWRKQLSSLGIDAQMVTGRELRHLEPALAPGLPGALHAPEDHQVDPRLLHAALMAGLARLNVAMHSSSPSLIVRGDRAVGVTLADGTVLEADNVVLAAGAWSGSVPGLPPRATPAVRPVKGQTLRVRLPGAPRLTRVVRGAVKGFPIYLVPRLDGEIVIGATSEEVGFDLTPRAGAVYELLRDAQSVFPELGAAIFFGHGGRGNGVGADILVALGGRYHLNDRNALVLRIGWPFGLQFGVTF